jgi:hypothetical protein
MTSLIAGMMLIGAMHTQASWVEQARQRRSREITREEALRRDARPDVDTRNRLSMRRIRPAEGTSDWNTDPSAIPFMLYQVNERTGLPVHINNDGLDVGSEDLFEELVVYLTSHYSWSFNEQETEYMGKWLRRGGTLLLDDCYNKGSPFVDSVNPEVEKMIPGAEPIMLLQQDPRVADAFAMVYPSQWPGGGGLMRPWQYFLCEGRPSVFFTPNDDGCGWEVSTPPTASNPIGEGIGHGGDNRQREQFYQLISNWMMFVYTR